MVKKKQTNKITKDTIMAEALDSSDKANEILQGYIGVACMGCGGQFFETIEMALESHGKKKELTKVINELNKVAGKVTGSK